MRRNRDFKSHLFQVRGLAKVANRLRGASCSTPPRAGGGIVPPLGETANPWRLDGRPEPSAGQATGRESPSARPARPGLVRYVNAGREPLPGTIPFSRGDLVRVRRGEHACLDRVKAVVWRGDGWKVELILCGTVPLGCIERREISGGAS